MDYRLIKIKEHSKNISKLRVQCRETLIDENSYRKIIEDLDAISESLNGYGNPVRIKLIIKDTPMTFEIAAYEGDIFRYKLYEKEDKNFFYSLSPNYSIVNVTEFLNDLDAYKKEHPANKDYLPIPVHEDTKAFLIDNWNELYSEILDKILIKLEKEENSKRKDLELIQKYT